MIIWIASYPRSGNTFFRVILNKNFGLKTYSIYNDLEDIEAHKKTKKIVGHKLLPKDFDINKAQKSKTLYLIKTHNYPQSKSDKAIYLYRDGRESVYSYYKYTNNYSTIEKSIDDFIKGRVYFGSWSDHLNAWSQNKNLLLLKFEELIKNPEKLIDQISSFIGVDPKTYSVPTFNELQSINPKFFNSGKTNSWKNFLTDTNHKSFWLKNYAQLKEKKYISELPSVFSKNTEIAELLSIISKEQNSDFTTVFTKLESLDSFILNKISEFKSIIEDKLISIEVELKRKDKVLANKNFEIKSLLEDNYSKNEAIIAKDIEIKSLADDNKGQSEDIEKLIQQIEAKNYDLTQKNEAIIAKDIEIKSLADDNKGQSEAIEKLIQQIEAKNYDLTQKNEAIIAKDIEIKSLADDNKGQSEAIEKLIQQIEAKKNDLTQKNEAIIAKDIEIKSLSDDNNTKNDYISALKNELLLKVDHINEKKNIIQKLNNKIYLKDKIIIIKNSELKSNEEDLVNFKNQLSKSNELNILLKNSHSYRIGHYILWPAKKIIDITK